MTKTDTEFLKIARGVQLARSGAGREVRLRAGVSQAAISARIGVTPGAVSLWESGDRTPRGEHAARYFDVIALLRDEVDKLIATWVEELAAVPVIRPRRWAELSGMATSTVYDAITNGTLPGIHIGSAIFIPTVPLLELLGAGLDEPATSEEPT